MSECFHNLAIVLNEKIVVTEARKSSKGQTDSVLNGLIPMLATPFLLQTTFLPAILLGVKLMLIQGIFLGKLAIILGLVNLLRNNIQDKQGHLYSHNIHANHGYDT